MADEIIQHDQGYIKLYKNETAKAVKYNWEIKVFNPKVDADLIGTIKDLDTRMQEQFPTGVIEE